MNELTEPEPEFTRGERRAERRRLRAVRRERRREAVAGGMQRKNRMKGKEGKKSRKGK